MSKTKTKPAAKAATKPAVKAAPKVAAKPAAPAAPVKAATPAPVAAKPAAKEVTKKLYIMTDIARPVSGPRLFAHTIAALTVLGMFGKDRPGVLRSALQAMVGGTAIRYHVRTKGTMVEKGDRVALTEPGVVFFKGRTFDPADKAAFMTLFTKGDGTAAKVRAQHIVPVQMAV